jgi:hypothetical protein
VITKFAQRNVWAAESIPLYFLANLENANCIKKKKAKKIKKILVKFFSQGFFFVVKKNGAEKNSQFMIQWIAKAFSILLRVLVTSGFLFYIFAYVIEWQDSIVLNDNSTVYGKIMSHSSQGVCIEEMGKDHWYKNSEIAEKNNQKQIHFGFLSTLKKLNLGLFFLFSLFFFCDTFLCSFRLRWLFTHCSLSLKKAIQINFIGVFFNNFLPGFTGGDVVRAYYVAKGSNQKTKAIVAVLMDRILGMTALILIGCTALIFHLKKPEFFIPSCVIFFSLAACSIGFLGVFFLPEKFYKDRPGILFLVIKSFCDYRIFWKMLLYSLGISLVVHIFCNIGIFGFALCLGIANIPWFVFFVYVPVGLLIMALPISISGWGVGEAAFGFLFSQVGLPFEQGVMLSLLMRLAHLEVGLVGAGIWMFEKK